MPFIIQINLLQRNTSVAKILHSWEFCFISTLWQSYKNSCIQKSKLDLNSLHKLDITIWGTFESIITHHQIIRTYFSPIKSNWIGIIRRYLCLEKFLNTTFSCRRLFTKFFIIHSRNFFFIMQWMPIHVITGFCYQSCWSLKQMKIISFCRKPVNVITLGGTQTDKQNKYLTKVQNRGSTYKKII